MKAVIYTEDAIEYLGKDIRIMEEASLEKVIKYVKEYKRVIASGVSYENLKELSKYDIELFLDIKSKLDMLDIEYKFEQSAGIDYLNQYQHEYIRSKYEQTATDSINDAKYRALALRLVKKK